MSRDCQKYANDDPLDQSEISKCMLSNFKKDCRLDRTGRTIDQEIVQECKYSNWSTDCKVKDIYVDLGRNSDTWKLTDGTKIDPSENE